MPDPNSKVVQIAKCDGTFSNVGILVECAEGGSLAHRQDGPMNCCPQALRNICLGDVPWPSFPHPQHESDYGFLGI
jgi:hypothetical protein